ncbi:MAG: FeoB small GTPase domain-containing protein [Methanomassiliicoccales archaeon]
MRVLMMGHPNVGKSALFNHITGSKVVESNYPGTTVDYTYGHMRANGGDMEVIDVPGAFSLKAKDRAEEVAVRMLEENSDAVVMVVIDASKVERGLYLALEIIERGRKVVVALNMWDVARDHQVNVDVHALREILQVPVIPTVAVGGEGLKELVESIPQASTSSIEGIRRRMKEMS